jgi:hypothetical protein
MGARKQFGKTELHTQLKPADEVKFFELLEKMNYGRSETARLLIGLGLKVMDQKNPFLFDKNSG